MPGSAPPPPFRRLYRLTPSASTQSRGFAPIALRGPDGASRTLLAPVGDDIALLLDASTTDAVPTLAPGDGTVEELGLVAVAQALFRRRFTSLRRSILNFDGVEVYPDGSKSENRRFRKQLNVARHAGMAADSALVRSHPELILGWPPEDDAPPPPPSEGAPKIAVAAHFHYADLWPELERLLRRWSVRPTLFLTLTRDDPELARRLPALFPGSTVRVVENRGRDIRPFLLPLEEGAFDGFDLVCKIHSKKSLGGGRHKIFGEIWRRATYLDLFASDAQVGRIAAMFQADAGLGLIGPRRFRSISTAARPRDLLGPNRPTVEALAARMGRPIVGDAFDFFEGAMFWARPQALEPIRKLGLSREAFDAGDGKLDGGIEHAIERLFNHAARIAGFSVGDVAFDDAGKDFHLGDAGVRPKIARPGGPSTDFLLQTPKQHGVAGLINLFGVESPGLTSCLAIGEWVSGVA